MAAKGAKESKSLDGGLEQIRRGSDILTLKSIVAAVTMKAKFVTPVILEIPDIPDKFGQCHCFPFYPQYFPNFSMFDCLSAALAVTSRCYA
jgi:hypothetical protein